MKPARAVKQISHLFQSIGPSPRLQIVLAIGEGEACVCHLEALLGHRQAYISQHLMALRQAKIVVPRREGRNVFYRLANPGLLRLIRQAGVLSGSSAEEIQVSGVKDQVPHCVCPHCNEAEPAFVPATAVTVQTG